MDEIEFKSQIGEVWQFHSVEQDHPSHVLQNGSKIVIKRVWVDFEAKMWVSFYAQDGQIWRCLATYLDRVADPI